MDKSFTSLICKKGPSRQECARFIEKFKKMVIMSMDIEDDKSKSGLESTDYFKYENNTRYENNENLTDQENNTDSKELTQQLGGSKQLDELKDWTYNQDINSDSKELKDWSNNQDINSDSKEETEQSGISKQKDELDGNKNMLFVRNDLEDEDKIKAMEITRRCHQFRITIEDYVITINTGKKDKKNRSNKAPSEKVDEEKTISAAEQTASTRSSENCVICKGSMEIDMDEVPTRDVQSSNETVIPEQDDNTKQVIETIQILVKQDQSNLDIVTNEDEETPIVEIVPDREQKMSTTVNEDELIETIRMSDLVNTKNAIYTKDDLPTLPELETLTSRVVEFIKMTKKNSPTYPESTDPNEILESQVTREATQHESEDGINQLTPPEASDQYPQTGSKSNQTSDTLIHYHNKTPGESVNDKIVDKINNQAEGISETTAQAANADLIETIEVVTFPEKEHSLMNTIKLATKKQSEIDEDSTIDLSASTENSRSDMQTVLLSEPIEVMTKASSQKEVNETKNEAEENTNTPQSSKKSIVSEEKATPRLVKEIFRNSSINLGDVSARSSEVHIVDETKGETLHESEQMAMLADVSSDSLCRILSAVLEELSSVHDVAGREKIKEKVVVISDNYYIINIEQLRTISGIMDRLDNVLNELLIKNNKFQISRRKYSKEGPEFLMPVEEMPEADENIARGSNIQDQSTDKNKAKVVRKPCVCRRRNECSKPNQNGRNLSQNPTKPLANGTSIEPYPTPFRSSSELRKGEQPTNTNVQVNNGITQQADARPSTQLTFPSSTTTTSSDNSSLRSTTSGRKKSRFHAFRNNIYHRDAINVADELLDLLSDVEKLLIKNCADRYEMMLLLEQILSEYSTSARKALGDLKKFIVTFNKNNSYL